MKPTLKQTETYHRRKAAISRVILGTIGNKEVIYGERALQARFPRYLERPTRDYDVFTPTPKRDAAQTEKRLDALMGGNYFTVEPAQHEGTYKVKSRLDGETVADFTKRKTRVPHDSIRGKNYVKLAWVKRHIKSTLKKKSAEFRHAKDQDALNRILVYEKKGGR